MSKIVVAGGTPLYGDVRISGAKNAVLPILCATLLADAPVEISNVPYLHDVITMINLLRELGAGVTMNEGIEAKGRSITVDPRWVRQRVVPYDLVKTMRASVLLLGPLLACYGAAEVALPGGVRLVHVRSTSTSEDCNHLVRRSRLRMVTSRLLSVRVD